MKENVEEFLTRLSHPRIDEIQELRSIIKEAEPRFQEHIKWNAPSYQIEGEDYLTFRISPPAKLQLIFHRGAKVKEPLSERIIDHPNELLIWAANDRAIATFLDIQDILTKKNSLKETIRLWVAKVTSG